MRRSRFYYREAEYRRTLAVSTSLSIAIIASLFLFSAPVSQSVVQEWFGWEGETQLLPEIAIIPGADPFDTPQVQTQYRPMEEVEVEEESIVDRGEGPKPKEDRREAPEEIVSPEIKPEEPRRYTAHSVSSYSENYVLLHMVKPDYPPEELNAGIEGDVTVELLIDEGGNVEGAWVLEAAGPRSFESATLDAVRQFRFKPPIVDGRPSSMWISFQIRFRITG